MIRWLSALESDGQTQSWMFDNDCIFLQYSNSTFKAIRGTIFLFHMILICFIRFSRSRLLQCNIIFCVFNQQCGNEFQIIFQLIVFTFYLARVILDIKTTLDLSDSTGPSSHRILQWRTRKTNSRVVQHNSILLFGEPFFLMK